MGRASYVSLLEGHNQQNGDIASKAITSRHHGVLKTTPLMVDLEYRRTMKKVELKSAKIQP